MLERHSLEKFGIAAQQGFVLLAGITPTIINKIIFIFPEVIIKQFESPDSYVVRLLEKLFQSAGRDTEQVRIFHHLDIISGNIPIDEIYHFAIRSEP